MASPPDYGRRLLPAVIDELAVDHPDHVLYAFPRNGKLEEGFRDVSAREFANAVNRTAWWFESLMGRGTSSETIAYIGNHDIRYMLLMIAAVKAGFQVLILSPRNSIRGQQGLMEKTGCKTIALPSQRHESVAKLLEASGESLKVLEVPALEELLLDEPVKLYPFTKTWEEAWQEPLFITHTSGTTGVPKAVICRHGLAGCWDSVQHIPDGPDGTPARHRNREGQTIFCTYPFFHIMGVMAGLCTAPFFRATNVIGPPTGIPSLALVEQVMSMRKIDGWVILPPVVEELAIKPELLRRFHDAEYILTGGGPVSHERGITVAKVVKLRNLIGASESLTLQCWDIEDPNDWRYFRWHPSMNVDMREVAPGLFECWVVRKPELAIYQGAFHTFPDLQEYNFRDLYTRHPDPNKADLWCSSGRSDDIIVLGNGEKIQPADMESIVASHPEVTGALVVGSGQFQPAIIIELRDPTTVTGLEGNDRAAFLDSIWATVEKANAIAPAHAQIHRNYIMLAEPGKRLLRADKGSVLRRAAVQFFKPDIDRFYQKREDEYAEEALSGIDTTSLESIQAGIRGLLARILSVPAEKIAPDADIFGAGLDSLQVFIIIGALRGVLRQSSALQSRVHELKPHLVYTNPTVRKLSSAFYRFVLGVEDGGENKDLSTTALAVPGTQAAEALLEKYSRGLPSHVGTALHDTSSKAGLHVVLTGSTGSLGSYLLDELLQQPSVGRITCLNRAEDGKAKQLGSSSDRGLDTQWPEDKVAFAQVDMSKKDFGLPSEVFADLLDTADVVIHNAWPVNFNWNIASFEPHIAGVRNLVDFSAKSRLGTAIFFISSMGTAMALDADRKVPEDIIHDLSAGLESGYASSKLVAELVLDQATKKSVVRATICRVGQIAGPVLQGVKGFWNRQEWLPTLIATSKKMGLLPSTLGAMDHVDWIPVDVMAKIVLELAGFSPKPKASDAPQTDGKSRTRVFHGINPKATSWATLVPAVLDHFAPSLKLVSWTDWLQGLREGQAGATSAAAHEMTGLKLVDFFEEIGSAKRPAFATAATEEESAALRQLEAVSPEWMDLWLKQWNF